MRDWCPPHALPATGPWSIAASVATTSSRSMHACSQEARCAAARGETTQSAPAIAGAQVRAARLAVAAARDVIDRGVDPGGDRITHRSIERIDHAVAVHVADR